MRKKVMIAIGVFLVIFISAWWANEINEKRYYIEESDDNIQLLMLDGENRIERFKPREYIKIKR